MLSVGLAISLALIGESSRAQAHRFGKALGPAAGRLTALLKDDDAGRAKIEHQSSSPEECDRRYREWLAQARPSEEIDFILQCARTALKDDPVDWSGYLLCMALLNRGSSSRDCVRLAAQVVESVGREPIMFAHFQALTASIGVLGAQRVPESAPLLDAWARADYWAARPVLVEGREQEHTHTALRRTAIAGIMQLPYDCAKPLLIGLQRDIEKARGSESTNSASERETLLKTIHDRLEDLELQKKNLPPKTMGIRGYWYRGNDSPIHID